MSFVVSFVRDHYLLIAVLLATCLMELFVVPRIQEAVKREDEQPPLSLNKAILCIFLIVALYLIKHVLEFNENIGVAKNPPGYEINGKEPISQLTASDGLEPVLTVEKTEQQFIDQMIQVGSMQVIRTEKLEDMSDRQLYLLRNGIYAKAGRAFVEEALTEYYEAYTWYDGYIAPNDFNWEMFNSFQKKTLSNIIKVEEQRAGR